MTAPTEETLEAYATVARGLFPRGGIWFDLDDGPGVKDLAVRALATDPARISEEIEAWVEANMMDTLDAAGAARWEKLMKLQSDGLSIEQRRAQIIAKWRGYGDPSLPNLKAIASAWSDLFPVFKELQWYLFEVGINAVGDPLRGDIWAVTLEIEYDGPDANFERAMRASVPVTTNLLFTVRSF